MNHREDPLGCLGKLWVRPAPSPQSLHGCWPTDAHVTSHRGLDPKPFLNKCHSVNSKFDNPSKILLGTLVLCLGS